MPASFTHARSLALVALVAMSSLVVGAPRAAAAPTQACCVKATSARCCCCPREASQAGPTAASRDAALASAAAGLRGAVPAPAGLCCRPPSAPARDDSRRDSRTTEERPTGPEAATLLPAEPVRPLTSPRPAGHETACPPRAALYLRIERLIL